MTYFIDHPSISSDEKKSTPFANATELLESDITEEEKIAQENSDNSDHKGHADKEKNTKSHRLSILKGTDKFMLMKRGLPELGRPIALSEEELPRGSHLSILVICAMLLTFVLWASVTPIKEIAVAPGQVVPSGFVKTVQHLEGGIIKHIFVQDGDYVKEGDTLMALDPAAAFSELEQLKAREASLRIKAERLKAFGMNQEPDFKSFDPIYQKLIDDQQAIFDMQSKNRADQRDIILKQIDQRKAALHVQEGRVQDIQRRIDVLQKQRDVIKGLYEKRLKTGSEYRTAEDSLAEITVDLNQAKNTALETEQGIQELESRLIELDTRLRNESLIDMGNVAAEIAQITEAKIKLEDRVRRLEIKAPSEGIVKGIKNTTLQGVIQPGAEIMQIVPRDSLEVEAKVQPKDIGKLHPDQHVLVKVSAYDYTRYGGIDGKVKSISATTFSDDKGNPYYRVLIHLSKAYVGKDPTHHRLTPGMTVQTDIETDEKTLFQYLMKPIYVALHESFREK